MDQLLHDDDGLAIFRREGRYYVRYDAGAHMVAWREDEISQADALRAMNSVEEATSILFELQRRLLEQGIHPYRSNIEG